MGCLCRLELKSKVDIYCRGRGALRRQAWYLIFASCVGSFETENLECTEAEIISEHLNQPFCEEEMDKYKKSGITTLCVVAEAVSITVPRGTKGKKEVK